MADEGITLKCVAVRLILVVFTLIRPGRWRARSRFSLGEKEKGFRGCASSKPCHPTHYALRTPLARTPRLLYLPLRKVGPDGGVANPVRPGTKQP